MKTAMTDARGQTTRWPRLLGVILLAAGVQAALGAWVVGGEDVAAYLAGCAATAGVVGVLLLAVPLQAGRVRLQVENGLAEQSATADGGGM